MPGAGASGKRGWMGQLKEMLAENWSRAEERVRARRAAEAARNDVIADMAESGRKGGETATATMPRPVAEAQGRPASPSTAKPGWREELNERTERTQAHEAKHAGALDIAKRVFKEFGADNGTLMAAAISYYLMLSLVPLVLVGIAIMGMVMGSNAAAQAQVIGMVNSFLPMKDQQGMIQNAVQGVIQSRGVVGGIGLIGLALTALSGFETLETAINIAWNTPKRAFLMSKLFALAMMLLVGGLLLLSLGATAVGRLATSLPVFGWLGMHDFARGAIEYVAPLIISTGMFTLIYKLFPNAKAKEWKPALIAGLITAVLWEAFKQAYGFLAPRYMHQGATYGSLAGFVGLIVWIYYSTTLVLLGSELAWVLEGCPGEKEDKKLGAAS